jgi:hypothetical protein
MRWQKSSFKSLRHKASSPCVLDSPVRPAGQSCSSSRAGRFGLVNAVTVSAFPGNPAPTAGRRGGQQSRTVLTAAEAVPLIGITSPAPVASRTRPGCERSSTPRRFKLPKRHQTGHTPSPVNAPGPDRAGSVLRGGCAAVVHCCFSGRRAKRQTPVFDARSLPPSIGIVATLNPNNHPAAQNFPVHANASNCAKKPNELW